jgi:ABC-type multidrug transport system fused ATPase/permease subunit
MAAIVSQYLPYIIAAAVGFFIGQFLSQQSGINLAPLFQLFIFLFMMQFIMGFMTQLMEQFRKKE